MKQDANKPTRMKLALSCSDLLDAALSHSDVLSEAKPSWTILRICNNVYVVEVPSLRGVNALITQHEVHGSRYGFVVICISRKLSDEEKVTAVVHELSHLSQFCKESSTAKGQRGEKAARYDEAVAKDIEHIFVSMLANYPPFMAGMLKLIGQISSEAYRRTTKKKHGVSSKSKKSVLRRSQAKVGRRQSDTPASAVAPKNRRRSTAASRQKQI